MNKDNIQFIEGSGLQLLLKIKVLNCSVGFEFKPSKVRNDKRSFQFEPQLNKLKINATDGSKFGMEFMQRGSYFNLLIEGKRNYFDAEIAPIYCSHMETNPNIEVTLRKSGWSGITPTLIVEAIVLDGTPNPKPYFPYKGELNGFNKIIDVVNH